MVSQLRSDELRRVLAQRKLLLILDLDHTLLNSARTTDVRRCRELVLSAPSDPSSLFAHLVPAGRAQRGWAARHAGRPGSRHQPAGAV